MTKPLQKKLTLFIAKILELSNHLRKLCGLDPMFIAAQTTPIIPTSGNIFNKDPIFLDAIKSFHNDMCSTTDSKLLELEPKVSKLQPFLPTRKIEVESLGVSSHRL